MLVSNIVLDLSILKLIPSRLLPEGNIELEMIKFYSYYQDEVNSIYNKFTKFFLNYLCNDDKDHKIEEIYKYYKPIKYMDIVMSYNNKLDLVIISKSKIYDFINIEYSNTIEDKEDKLYIEFKVTQHE